MPDAVNIMKNKTELDCVLHSHQNITLRVGRKGTGCYDIAYLGNMNSYEVLRRWSLQ